MTLFCCFFLSFLSIYCCLWLSLNVNLCVYFFLFFRFAVSSLLKSTAIGCSLGSPLDVHETFDLSLAHNQLHLHSHPFSHIRSFSILVFYLIPSMLSYVPVKSRKKQSLSAFFGSFPFTAEISSNMHRLRPACHH